MRYLQILCLAFALTTMSVSMVVYGKLTTVHKNTCLVISFPQSAYSQSNSESKLANDKLKGLQQFLDANKIPLEISYVIASAHYSVPDSFFNFCKEKLAPSFTEPQAAPPAPEPVKILSEEVPDTSVDLYQAELSKASVEAKLMPVSSQLDSESLEKPVLRTPNL